MKILAFIGSLAVLAAFEALLVWGVENLWNSVVVTAFHAPTLTFWQVFAILCLLQVVGSFFKGGQ